MLLLLTSSGKCMSGGSIPFLGAAKFQVDVKEGVRPKHPVDVKRGKVNMSTAS